MTDATPKVTFFPAQSSKSDFNAACEKLPISGNFQFAAILDHEELNICQPVAAPWSAQHTVVCNSWLRGNAHWEWECPLIPCPVVLEVVLAGLPNLGVDLLHHLLSQLLRGGVGVGIGFGSASRDAAARSKPR